MAVTAHDWQLLIAFLRPRKSGRNMHDVIVLMLMWLVVAIRIRCSIKKQNYNRTIYVPLHINKKNRTKGTTVEIIDFRIAAGVRASMAAVVNCHQSLNGKRKQEEGSGTSVFLIFTFCVDFCKP